ncbi:hypothetical protein [Halolamina litorea]|uniref:Uncharacterized protein n=1 Tax=Halolamina litorea TaxID=1515593 RepID=A0ABD6BV08_9EURY|nr:hypothetical protein [Halolamina litorea]
MSDRTDDPGSGWFDTEEPMVRGSGLSGHVRRWLLIDGNRWVLALLLAGFVFAFVLAVGVLDGAFREAVRTNDPIETAFSGLATGIITGVTLVVTIDQLVLSRQLGPLAEQRQQLDDSLRFHREVEQVIDGTSPAEPGRFIAAVVATIDDRAAALTATVAASDTEFAAAVERFVDEHEHDSEVVSQRRDARYLRFNALRAALEYDYSHRVHEARRLRREYDEELTDEQREVLTELIDALRFLGPAREHIRGLYFQAELVKLSRVILTAAVPALAISLAAVFFLDAGDVPGTTLGAENLVVTVTAAATVSVTPFLLLVSYVLRIVTITEQTLTTGSFVLREDERPGE